MSNRTREQNLIEQTVYEQVVVFMNHEDRYTAVRHGLGSYSVMEAGELKFTAHLRPMGGSRYRVLVTAPARPEPVDVLVTSLTEAKTMLNLVFAQLV